MLSHDELIRRHRFLLHPGGGLNVCGRPTRKNEPCKRRQADLPACNVHITREEKADLLARIYQRLDEINLSDHRPLSKPACWSWPVSSEDLRLAAINAKGHLAVWQDNRCGVCGDCGIEALDHDHETGWIRGHLCQSCNLLEPGGGKLLRLYRKLTPARMLGIWKRYVHPIYGSDFGRLDGRSTQAPHPVDPCRVVQFERPSPVLSVAACLLGDSAVTSPFRPESSR